MARITRENRREHMLSSPMYKLIPALAVPTVMTNIINAFYNLADTYFVSRIGTYATGAVGINASLDQMLGIAGAFFAMGASSFISRLLGAKEEKKAEQVLASALVAGLVFGLAVLVLGKLFIVPLVRLMGAIPEIEQYAIDYADYVLYAAPFFVLQIILSQSLRSEGSATYAFIGISLGGFLNCGLDPLFITTFGMGVKGASVATALSKLVSFSILLLPYLRKKTLVRFNLRSFSIKGEIWGEIITMGAPGLSRSSLQVIAAIAMNRIAGAQFSASTLAAISVTNRLFMTLRSACLGYAQGFQPVAGFCWGAKRYDRVMEAYKFAYLSLAALITIPAAVMFIFAPQVISAFTQTDAEMLAIGTIALRLQTATLPFFSWTVVVNSLYSGTGRAFGAMMISMSRQGICFFPLLYTLPRFFGLPGLISVQPGAEMLTILVVIPLALTMQRKLRQLQATADSSELVDIDSVKEVEVLD